jgi:hypothetical protein
LIAVAAAAVPAQGTFVPTDLWDCVVADGCGPPTWNSRLTGDNLAANHWSRAMALAPDSTRVFVTAATSSASGGLDYSTVAYDAYSGVRLWHRVYDGPIHKSDFPSAIAVDHDGGTVFVTGFSTSANGTDILTVAYYATNGTTKWTQRYDGPAHATDNGTGLAVDPTGKAVFVVGTVATGANGNDFYTSSLNASTGAVNWVYLTNFGADDSPVGIRSAPDGSRVFVAGRSLQPASPVGYSNYDVLTVARGAIDGSLAWSALYNGESNPRLDDIANAVELSPDGKTFFVAGYTCRVGTVNTLAIAYNSSTGATKWVSTYDGDHVSGGQGACLSGSGKDIAHGIAVSPDSSKVFITGESQPPTVLATDMVTIGYSANSGAQLWVAFFDGEPLLRDTGRALIVNPDGTGVFVAGDWPERDATRGVVNDFGLVGYETSSGDIRWWKRLDGGFSDQNDFPVALRMNNAGNWMFMTGSSQGSAGLLGVGMYGVTTIGYDLN